MLDAHSGVGTALVIGFAALVGLNLLRLSGRDEYAFTKYLSYAVAALLILQYIIGFSLLGDDHDITAWHYILAIAAIIPVGAEHMMATSTQPTALLARKTLAAQIVALALVIVVYAIGTSN